MKKLKLAVYGFLKEVAAFVVTLILPIHMLC